MRLHDQLGMCPYSDKGLGNIFEDLLAKTKVAVTESAQKAGERYIEQNKEKLITAGMGIADQLVTKYVANDPREVEAKLAQYGTAFTKSAQAEAKATLAQDIKDNWPMVLGASVAGLGVIFAVMYLGGRAGGKSLAKANPKRKRRKSRKRRK